ncbi:hypothetical protein ACFSSA_09910 [Luteolibacter algae]|uniref:Uncharacterized protein n=1 Tax=Luteolibacter algae TaxID=454151 RepID=A0ABW5D7Z6_9BACT
MLSDVVERPRSVYLCCMADEHVETTPVWVEGSALAAPVILGASAGLLVGDLMHGNARRGVGISLGILGVAALLPFAIDGVTSLITGPRSKFGVRRKIQKIRDIGIGTPSHDEVENELREQGVI